MAALARIAGRHLKSAGVFNSSSAFLFSQRRGVASKLFVGGLSFYATDQGLSEAFSQCGQVVEGFGFVTFASKDEAEKAITEMNGKQLNGRVIFVDYAKPKQSFEGGLPIARGPPKPVVVPEEN